MLIEDKEILVLQSPQGCERFVTLKGKLRKANGDLRARDKANPAKQDHRWPVDMEMMR